MLERWCLALLLSEVGGGRCRSSERSLGPMALARCGLDKQRMLDRSSEFGAVVDLITHAGAGASRAPLYFVDVVAGWVSTGYEDEAHEHGTRVRDARARGSKMEVVEDAAGGDGDVTGTAAPQARQAGAWNKHDDAAFAGILAAARVAGASGASGASVRYGGIMTKVWFDAASGTDLDQMKEKTKELQLATAQARIDELEGRAAGDSKRAQKEKENSASAGREMCNSPRRCEGLWMRISTWWRGCCAVALTGRCVTWRTAMGALALGSEIFARIRSATTSYSTVHHGRLAELRGWRMDAA
eukprot:6314521-Prymnesium_polylepis.1